MENNKTGPKLSCDVLARLPQTVVCKSALDLAWRALPEPILNHVVRTFLLARWLSQKEGSEWCEPCKLELLYVACICHDLGTSDLYNGSQRFEVESADVAKAHLLSHGMSEELSHQVWIAIALHTTAGIAERIYPLSRLLRHAVIMDFSPATCQAMGATEESAEIERHLPRLNIEKVLSDAVVHQAKHLEQAERPAWPKTEKYPKASWPGMLLRAYLDNPNYDGVNPAF